LLKLGQTFSPIQQSSGGRKTKRGHWSQIDPKGVGEALQITSRIDNKNLDSMVAITSCEVFSKALLFFWHRIQVLQLEQKGDLEKKFRNLWHSNNGCRSTVHQEVTYTHKCHRNLATVLIVCIVVNKLRALGQG
jgi:hypothetical protein